MTQYNKESEKGRWLQGRLSKFHLFGRKPDQLEAKVDTPDLWSAMGEVASQIEDKNRGKIKSK